MKSLAVVFSLLAASASAKIVYVAPTASGLKDGSSWENALSDFNAAYQAAGESASEASPAEVWVKKGAYSFPAYSVELKPYVSVRGGFSGGESSAMEADPDNNWTIFIFNYHFINPTSYKYNWIDRNNVVIGPIWEKVDGEWEFSPIPEGCYFHGSDSGLITAFADTAGAVQGVALDGLVFTGCSKGSAVKLANADSSVILRRCRFLGNGGYQSGRYPSVDSVSGASIWIESCHFEGCASPVALGSANLESKLVVTNCSFVSNYAGYMGGVVSISGAATVEIVDSTFRRSWLTGNQTAIDVRAGANHVKIRRCSFEDSRNYDGYGRACVLLAASNIKVDVEQCSFSGAQSGCNQSIVNSAGTCFCTAVSAVGISLDVRDTCFNHNFFEAFGNLDKPNYAWGCIAGTQSENTYTFINCTMVSNVVVNSVSGSSPHVALITGGNKKYSYAFSNCVFKDNDVLCVTAQNDTATTNRVAAFDCAGGIFTFLNTIVTHSVDDYVFFAGSRPTLASVCLKGYTDFPSVSPTLLDCDPKLAAAPSANNGVTAWGLALGSPCRKHGEPLWAGTDRNYYRYDSAGNPDSPWLSLYSVRLTDSEAAAVGVSLAVKPISDAFGREYRVGRVPMGPLDAPHQGLVLFIK